MSALSRSLTGAALAAATMYWFDPTSGRRRRARLRDQFTHLAANFGDGLGTAGRDIAHRTQGLGATLHSYFTADDAVDEVLSERIRSALGRAVSHPRSIKVTVKEGSVTLRGAVPADEYQTVLETVSAVRGVQNVQDELSVHTETAHVPELQGGRMRRRMPLDLMQENWAPATRLIAGSLGATCVLAGVAQLTRAPSRAMLGIAAMLGGSMLLVRSSTNMPIRRLAGRSGRRAIDIHKTLHVRAPVERVFETLANYQNFPAFMRNVRDVRMHEDGRSHWVVAGPGGISVEWDSETTAYEPNELLAWRSVRNATVQHAGIIRFERAGSGTRVDIQMSYNPPAGALGHVIAKLCGSDAKKELDEDLLRLKSFLETGVPPRDAARRGDVIPPQSPPPTEAPTSVQ